MPTPIFLGETLGYPLHFLIFLSAPPPCPSASLATAASSSASTLGFAYSYVLFTPPLPTPSLSASSLLSLLSSLSSSDDHYISHSSPCISPCSGASGDEKEMVVSLSEVPPPLFLLLDLAGGNVLLLHGEFLIAS